MATNDNLFLQRFQTNSSISIVDLTSNQDGTSIIDLTNEFIPKNSSMSLKSKHASIRIYRPPNLRSRDDDETMFAKSKLNVDAKEFVMINSDTKNTNVPIKKDDSKDEKGFKNYLSKVKVLAEANTKQFPLNTSKSSGNVALLNGTKFDSNHKSNINFKNSSNSVNYDLQRTKSSGNVLMNIGANGIVRGKVQFKMSDDDNNRLSGKSIPSEKKLDGRNLKRSKSEGSKNEWKPVDIEVSLPTFCEYELFPKNMRDAIKQAIENFKRIPDKHKIALARNVVENAIDNKERLIPATKLSMIIIKKDETEAYLDSLLNTCQMLYEKKETYLLIESAKFISFVSFLTKLYTELKQHGSQPARIILLKLITRCCGDILTKNDMHSLLEVECLHLTLTTLGRDIEWELPTLFMKIFHFIKVVFVKGCNESSVQKLLLQLIELRAANWQLPVSALNYYYPVTSQ